MAGWTTASAGRAIAFGPFRLLPTQRLLLEDGKPVRLGSRALDILIALTERPGELVGKAELLARVWRDRFVEEGNLKFQIAALRRILGDGHRGRRYIAASPGQGYRFVSPVVLAEEYSPGPPLVVPTKRKHNLPGLLVRLIGRSSTVARIAARLPRQRFLTIVGPGGIGKTSVAVAVAQNLVNAYEDGVWLVDLAPIAEASLVATALVATIGCEIHAEDPLPALIAFLKQKRMLLLLDNCEHVAETAAGLAVALLKGAAGVDVLATSREPLSAQGEYLHRLPALETPPLSTRLSAVEALAFPAVELFVERAAAGLGEYELNDADAPIVAEICRQLDGIPLAIEFAAARLDAFGIAGLAARLDDRLRLLTRGPRSALPRHRTLRAALDWSYGLLTEAEQKALRRLAIFAGSFTLDAAAVVAADAGQPEGEIVGDIAELVSKSLVLAETGDAEQRLRLPQSTRAYAMAKLGESGEHDMIARRHAEYYCNLFERAEAEWNARPTVEWLADHGRHLGNLRAALDWAFTPIGDISIGVALTAAAAPLWIRLSLVDECRSWVERALAALGAGASRDARREMKLQAALGTSLIYTRGPAGAAVGAAWTKAREIAESLDDAEYRLRSLWGLWSFHVNSGRYRVALALAEEFLALANKRSARDDRLVGARMIGTAQHHLGDLKSARLHFERVLAGDVAFDSGSLIARYQLDQRVVARASLASILWLQGFPDQAMVAAESSIKDARASNHVVSLCHALSLAACPIALWVGDLVASEHYVGMLLDYSTTHALAPARAGGHGYQGVILIKRGDVTSGLPLLRASLNEVGEANTAFSFLTFVSEIAEAMGRAGQFADALAAIEEVLALTERIEERWLIVELLRVKGEVLLMQDASGAGAAAEDLFRQSLDWARRHGALSWELRAATSLARLWRDHHRGGEARDLLASVYGRFTEGFDTTDLKRARRLLDELG